MNRLIPFLIKYSAYLIFPLLGFVLSVALTRMSILILPRFGLIDKPIGGRHIHEKLIPKGGGIALLTAFFVVWGIFLNSPWAYFIGDLRGNLYYQILLLSFPLFILGIIDDRYELKPLVKLSGQIIVAVFCWLYGIKLKVIFCIDLPDPVSLILTVIWIISFINAFNLIDGLDGLAPGLGVISSLCMASVFAITHNPNDTMVMLCFGACCAGFLIYNFYPAKIFLGDTGSMFIGFIFAVAGIISTNKSAAVTSVVVPMLAVGVPILDVCLAIWRRFTRRLIGGVSSGSHNSSITTADSEHLHHRLWRKGHLNQKKTTIKIYVLGVLFAGLAILHIMKNNFLAGFGYAVVLLIIFTFIRRIANIELWNTGKAILNGMGFPRKSVIVYATQPFLDAIVIVLIYLFCRFLFINSAYNINMPLLWYTSAFFTAAPIILLLNLSGCYRRNWLHGSAPDYIYFFQSLAVGFVLMLIIDFSGGIQGWKSFVAERLLFITLVTLILIGMRLSLHYLKHYLINQFYIDKNYDIDIEKILIFGTTLDCRYYIAHKNSDFEKAPFTIIGIIEDNSMFQKQYVFGRKVLGLVAEIETIYQKTPFDKITITRTISRESMKTLSCFCKAQNIKLVIWQTREKAVGER